MVALKPISNSIAERVIGWLVFAAMFSLPWINRIHIFTFLFIGIGLLLLVFKLPKISFGWLWKQWVFGLFLLYYILQIIAWCQYPLDKGNIAAISQKASLLAMPFIMYMLCVPDKGMWKWAVWGFVFGNIFAALCCFVVALVRYNTNGSMEVFFYHSYAGFTGMNAIYFSLYILVSLVYLLYSRDKVISFSGRYPWLLPLAVCWLAFNLLLLSSKMMIAMGGIVIFFFVLRSLKKKAQKLIVLTILCTIALLLFTVHNPVTKRYADIDLKTDGQVLHQDDFTGFQFDGLNLRLMLWRMGAELSAPNLNWITGQGGEHYHQALNEKTKAYKMYTGEAKYHNTGYLNYNMHNQYMESYVQFGLVGLGIIFTILGSFFYFSFIQPTVLLRWFVIITGTLFMTESVLETQSGILMFTIIISGEWIQLQQPKPMPHMAA